jgi:putative ABC transport system permease protein
MLKNYILIAVRNLKKNKIFSFINIFGLAVGLTCFMLIAVYVFNELTYDRYPDDAKDIYRVTLSVTGNGNVAVYPDVDVAVGGGMKDTYPEVKAFARIIRASDYVKYNDRQFKEDQLAFADSNFLEMFSIPLIEGNAPTALVEPNSVVISKSLAERYFGNQDPLGRTLLIGINNAAYKVTGVIDKVPYKSHFHFDAFLSMSTIKFRHLTWSNLGFYTYLQLNKNADPKKLEAKFPQLVAKYIVPEVQHDMGVSLEEAQKSVNTFVFSLQPLTDIHLYSHTQSELEPNGEIKYVYIFSALAIFILLLACVNFTNLSTARAAKRGREVGVRKVMGSVKKQLIFQFLTESIILTFIGMLCAFVLVDLLLPYFNEIMGANVNLGFFADYRTILIMFLLCIIVGTLAGIYPAFFLSAFNTIKVLKGSVTSQNTNTISLRSGLIIFQFFVSTALIIATIIVYQQLNYMQNKKLGYDKEQTLFIPDARLLGNNQDAFRQLILQDNRVVSATISRSIPAGFIMDGTEIYPKNESGNGTEIHANIYHVDYDYLKTLGISVLYGRNFSKEFPSDSAGVVINEAAARKLGWGDTNAIGKYIIGSGQIKLKVIGVVKDFNYESVKDEIAPLMMLLGRNYGGLIIKFKTNDVNGLLFELKEKWNSFNPEGPFNYTFLDDKFAALFANEHRTQEIFSFFTFIAIIIAGLGLFGLSAFVIEQRTKEIGIRKVLGATVTEIAFMLSKEFIRWVLIGNIIACFAAYYLMNKWLSNYAYRIDINLLVFLLSAIVTILIVIATISYQSIKAAVANPVKSLRYE